MRSKLEFITAYVLSAAQGYANARGGMDITAILDDAEHFYNQMEMRYGAQQSDKVKKPAKKENE